MKDSFAIKISGPAGTGIMQAGETFSKALNRLGFYTLVYPEYPSQIRGGDNNIQIVFSSQPVNSPQEKIDLLFAFNDTCLKNHQKEVKKGGLVFNFSQLGITIEEELVKNSASLGFIWSVLGFDLKVLQKQLEEDFGGKQSLLKSNLDACQKGSHSCPRVSFKIDLPKKSSAIANLTGNEALTKGLLQAKCDFAAIYPMTPINAVLTELSKSKITVFRPEDEIAGVLSAIGASYAGSRAMVATSGGGFALMVEGLGMAGIAEIPLVIVLGQRTGPSTGMATYSSQADLNFALHAGQGEFPRIVLTPGDLPELYRLGAEAFNLAEIYQVPVILMTDKFLAESRFSEIEENLKKVKIRPNQSSFALRASEGHLEYKRYGITPSGISPRAVPGQVTFLTNSYEHDEYGFSTDDAETRKKMMEKRMGKLENLRGGFEVFGPPSSFDSFDYTQDKSAQDFGRGKTTLVSWGSTKGILLDFIKGNPEYNLIHFWRAEPFPKEAIPILKKAKKVICVEGNYSGQMANVIKTETEIETERILKDDGRPFYLEEIESQMLKLKCHPSTSSG